MRKGTCLRAAKQMPEHLRGRGRCSCPMWPSQKQPVLSQLWYILPWCTGFHFQPEHVSNNESYSSKKEAVTKAFRIKIRHRIRSIYVGEAQNPDFSRKGTSAGEPTHVSDYVVMRSIPASYYSTPGGTNLKTYHTNSTVRHSYSS